MAAKLERTSTPGIFRRHVQSCDRDGRCDCRYVATWRDHGRKHTETYRTFTEARKAKLAREADAERSEFSSPRRVTLHAYAREWVERYQGTGRRGIREETRAEYQVALERFALRYFAPRVRLAELSPRMVADFIGWLVQRPSRRGGTLSDSSVRNAFKPLAACLATARREGLIRHSPAADVVLPHRPQEEEDAEPPRPFPTLEEGESAMELVVRLIHPEHRLMFELLAATGVRRSELLAFEGRDLQLAGERPYVKVRRRARRQRGRGMVLGPLKSRHARRELPVPLELGDRLAALGARDDQLVFPSKGKGGVVLDADNLAKRVLAPACEEADVSWAGFHTFRHTVASRLFAEGRNVVQVQRWLGHHSASFTLDTYVHLLDEDLGAPLEASRSAPGRHHEPQTAASDGSPVLAERGD